jgi:hypothetical protein
LGLGTVDFALRLATTNLVAASLDKSGVVTDHVVSFQVMDICLRVGGFLELSVSKDDLIYDFKCGLHFLKTISISKSLKKLLKVMLNTFYILLDLKSLPILAKMQNSPQR